MRRRRSLRKRVTWTRADRALIAIIALRECGDLAKYDPGGWLTNDLDHAADAARTIREQCKAPPSQR